jgi:hypothetical protein
MRPLDRYLIDIGMGGIDRAPTDGKGTAEKRKGNQIERKTEKQRLNYFVQFGLSSSYRK